MADESKGLKLLNVINGSIQSRTYTFGLFTIMVVLALVLGAIRPTAVKIIQINKEIKEKRFIAEQLDNKLGALASLSEEYGRNQTNMGVLPLIYPSSGNFSLFMSNIEEISKSYGFNLVGINFGSAEKIDMGLRVLKPWNARISVSGNKANFVKFMQQIESMPMYPVISKVAYTEDKDSNGLTPYSMEVLIFKIDDSNFYK